MLNVQISRCMIHKDASSNLLFRVWQYKRGNSRSLQIRFKMVNKYTIPRMSVWCFESTICISFTNLVVLLCSIYVSIHVFTCLTFIYFTFFSCCKLGRGEWINMAKHILDGLHVSVTKILVPHKKKLWWSSIVLFSLEIIYLFTSAGEADVVELWVRETGRYYL